MRIEVPAWFRAASELAWRSLVLLALAAAVTWILVEIHLVAFPVLLAVILSTLFEPPTRWLERRGVPRGVAAALTVVGGILVLAGATVLIASRIALAAPDLASSLSQARDQLVAWLSGPPLNLSLGEIQGALGQMFGGQGGGGAASQVVSGTRLAIEIVGATLLMIVTLFFFVKDGPTIVRWFLDLFPDERRPLARRLWGRSWEVLGRYLRGVVIIAAVDAAGTAVGLLILGVPLVVPLTVMMFLGGFVPVVGATVAGLVAVLVALVSVGPITAVLTLAMILVVQQVDAHLLQPAVMGHEVPLHPVMVLVAVGAGALLFGIPGAVIGTPVAAVLSAVGHVLREHDTRSAPAVGARAVDE